MTGSRLSVLALVFLAGCGPPIVDRDADRSLFDDPSRRQSEDVIAVWQTLDDGGHCISSAAIRSDGRLDAVLPRPGPIANIFMAATISGDELRKRQKHERHTAMLSPEELSRMKELLAALGSEPLLAPKPNLNEGEVFQTRIVRSNGPSPELSVLWRRSTLRPDPRLRKDVAAVDTCFMELLRSRFSPD